MSDSRRSKRNGGSEIRNAQSRSDSTPSSSSKRKSSKKSDPDRDGGFNPTSTSFSSTSQSPYPGMAAPSVASSYATANTTNPTNLPYQPPDLIRNESMQDQGVVPTGDTGRESRKKRDSERRRDRSSDSDNTKATRRSKRADKDERRRSSKKEEKPKRTDSERALDNHKASMVENQFPGEFPSTFAEPYRPPGLAADYYGDHGESVAYQPGVRPVPPSIIIAADQAHLHEATIEAAPPPEPSSLGQVGAAASFFGGTSDFESDPPPKPSKNGNRPGLKPTRQSTDGASSRSSLDPEGRPGPTPLSATRFRPAAMAGAGVGAAAGVGEAAQYFSAEFNPELTEGGSNAATSGYFAGQSVQNATQGMQNSNPGAINPPLAAQRPSSGSQIPTYGAAAAGIAAMGAGAYYASHHTTEEHHAMDNVAAGSYGPQNTGHSPSTPQNYQSQSPTQQRRRRRGPFSKIVDFFQDPIAVAEYEAYTEAIGVCKYCFEPGTSPRDAPRKHFYNRRYSDGRYGSNARVDKLNRYQSSEDEKRRRSNGKKWVATGLAGYGLAKMSEAATNRKNDFDDTYSVKSGRPEGSTRVSFAADERVSRSRRTKHSSVDDQAYSRQDSIRDDETKIRKDKRTGELYEERSSRKRRDSNISDRFSRGAAISAGVAAAGLVSAAGRRSRSKSPKKRYYSKRVSPNHSFVDLSATTTSSGGPGFASFFSSPSANQRKGKKPKGLGFFNFTNASSSSSDADLAFGAGSVRRKKGGRDDRKHKYDGGNVNTELLGLTATGLALAAEADRQDRKGKRRADLLVVKEPRHDRSRRHDERRPQNPVSESDEGNDHWTDASDDESSVDSALAYGGRLSMRQSKESLVSNDGTDKWAWRWNKGKKPRKRLSEDLSRFEPTATGEAAASSGRVGLTESTASLQSMQQLDPIPISDTNTLIIDRKTSSISPTTKVYAPLEHPQPFAPISQIIHPGEASAPAPMYSPGGPPVFSQYPSRPPQAPMTESPKQLPAGFETEQPRPEEKRRRRRNSSPTPSQIRDDGFEDKSRRRTSTRDMVKFDLTEEQREKDTRTHARQRRQPKPDDHSEEKRGDRSNFQQESSLERERDEISSSRRSSTDARTARELEIERELKRLYEEDRRQKEARKSKRADTWPAVAAIGTGVTGAAVIAAARSTSAEDKPKVDQEERQSRRKSAMKQTTASPAVDDDRSDSQQRRIARMAAARVKSTPSPVHDDYASYFIPPELAGNVKEHNFTAEHRDDPAGEPAQIVEVAPRTARRKDTFDPFLYRPFGIEPEDDPRRYPWPVPLLDIIEPTPPVSVRGDMSPLPTISPELPEVPEISDVAAEKRQKRSSSVTWGEHRTHEYEVITPLEDHEEFVHAATYESSQPAIDLAERTHSDVKAELSEPETVSISTNGVPHTSAEKDVPAPAHVDAEPQPKTNYGQDLEFAAVLAAAAEGAGFDPSIVVNDPTYHRRDSPPGSGDASFYRSPFAETASDLGTFHDCSVPPQPGFVEDEISPTPADEASKQGLEAERNKEFQSRSDNEQVDVEPKIPGGFNVFEFLGDPTAETANSVNTTSTEDHVVVSLDEDGEMHRQETHKSSEMYTSTTESVRSQPIESEPNKKLKRSSTLDEGSFEVPLDKSDRLFSYASDPEGFDEKGRSRRKPTKKGDRATEVAMVGAAATAIPAIDELVDSERRRRRLEREDDDYYEKIPPISASEPGADTPVDSKKSRRKSKRNSDIWDDAKSVASSPAEVRDDRESGKKSKKKPKRDNDTYDDDSMSVSSLPADLNGDKASSRKSKDRKSGGFFGLFSSSKPELSTSQKWSSKEMDRQSRNGRDTKSEDLDEPKRKSKRKSKDKNLDDASSDLQPSRNDSQPSVKDDVRQQSPDDEFVSSEETARDNERTEDGMSFLGERPEMPTVHDGASGSTPKAKLAAEQSISVQLPTVLPDRVSSTVRSRSVSPRTKSATVDEHEDIRDEATSPSVQRDQFRQRHLAEIRTSDIFSSPLAASSPTAVPLHFRRLPVSPGFVRSASVGSTSTGSPMSPVVTPRTRQGRPTSTEFRNSKEFRPLYLVERHSSIKQPELEVEETYPSLPSSRTSSAHPSMENLRGDDQGESFAEKQINLSQIRDRRHSFSNWRDERPMSPDYLDSKTTTPTATEFPKEFKRVKPKYEFHSPSELLEDPSRQLVGSQEHQSPPFSPMVLPSVGSPASSVAKNDSAARTSRLPSPARDQDSADHMDLATNIGLGLVGSAATALVASQLVGDGVIAAVTAEEPISTKETPQDSPHASATSAMPLDENPMPIDPPTSRETQSPTVPQAADNAFALQPIPSKKKSKKDKKRKLLNQADEPIETRSSSLDADEELENVGSLAAKSDAERLPASGVNVRDLPSGQTASLTPQPEHNVPDIQALGSTNSAELGKLRTLAASHVNKQALPEQTTESEIPIPVEELKDNAALDEAPVTSTTEGDKLAFSTTNLKEDKKTEPEGKDSVSVSQMLELAVVAPVSQQADTSFQSTLIDKSPFASDNDLPVSSVSETLSQPEEKVDAQIPSDKESTPAVSADLVRQDRNISFDSTLATLDDTDRTEGLDEKSSRDSYPFDEPIAVSSVETPALSRPSALEEAFAKAEAARGTAPEVSEEEAFEAFQPRNILEPSLGYGRLDTIAEGSREGSKVDLAQVEEAMETVGENQRVPSKSKSKKEKKKDKKSKNSSELDSFDTELKATTRDDVEVPAQKEREAAKEPGTSTEHVEAVTISDPRINPFGDDYVMPREDNITNNSFEISHELDEASATQVEGASAAVTPSGSPVQIASALKDLDEPVEEFSWALTSKKDKKKGKKGRTSALISEASTPMTEMSSTESIDPPEVKQLDADTFAVSTKKSKKGKKKDRVLDGTSEDAIPKQKDDSLLAEEPLETVAKIEQDTATKENADDSSLPGVKKAKKNKKKIQALDWTDEAATPQTEENVETTAESQREISTAEAETENLAWATTKKSKKDKKKSKKSALLDEAAPEVDVAPEVEPTSVPDTVEEQVDITPEVEPISLPASVEKQVDITPEVGPISVPATVEEQVAAVDDAPQFSVAGVPDRAALPPDELALLFKEPVLPPEEPALPREEPALPPEEPALPPGEPALPPGEPALPPGEPALPPGEPALTLKEPALPSKELILPLEPALPLEEPVLLLKEPALPIEEPILLPHEPSMPRVIDEVSQPLDESLGGHDQDSMPRDEAAIPWEHAPLPQHDHHVFEPAKPSQFSAPVVHEPQMPEPIEASQSLAPELQEQKVAEPVEWSPAPDLNDQEVPQTVIAEEKSKLEDPYGVLDSLEVPPQASEQVASTTAPSGPSDDCEVSMAREVSEPSKGLRQVAEISGDHSESTLRDSRWASVFGELKARKLPESSEVPQQVAEVCGDDQKSTFRDPALALVFGELKQRKVSEPAREEHETVAAPDVEQEKQVSVPAGVPLQIDTPGEKIETAIATDSRPDHEEMQPQTQEPSPEQMPQGQVEPLGEHIQPHEQAYHTAIEQPASHIVSQPVEATQNIHDQIPDETEHAAHQPTTEISSRLEPMPREAILSDNREVSDYPTESRFQEAAQPETVTQLERPGEAEMPGDLFHTTTRQAEEQADEISWAPPKRGKKDKKRSKSKQLKFDDLAEPSSDSSRSKDITSFSVAAGAAMEAENETPPTATPAEEPSGEADVSSWGPAKKSKKDKKKKKALAFADETFTPANDDLSEERSSIPESASLARLADDTTTEKPISEETQVAKDINAEDEIQVQTENISTLSKRAEDPLSISATPEYQQAVFPEHEPVQEYAERDAAQTTGDKALSAEPDTIPEEPDEYSRAATPKKKGKKDKKKRGSILETSGSATPQTEDEPPLAEDTVDSVAPPKAELAEEDERAFSTKKSKKDKKKKKTTFSSLEDAAEPENEDLQATRDTSKEVETDIHRDTVEWTRSDVLAMPIVEQDSEDRLIGHSAPVLVEIAKPEENLRAIRDTSEGDKLEIDQTPFEQPQADIRAMPIAEQEPEDQAVGYSALETAEVAKTDADLEGTRDMSQGKGPKIDRNNLDQDQVNVLATSIPEQEPEDGTIRLYAPKLAEAEGIGSATEREVAIAIPEREAIADQAEKQPMVANKSILKEESLLEHKPTAVMEEESSWAPAPKKSKKGKKDKKNLKSTAFLEESQEDSSSPANGSDFGITETVQDQDHRVLTESGLTSGYDRVAETDIIMEKIATAEPGSSGEQERSLEAEVTEERQKHILPGVAEPEAAAEDDASASTGKKNKKNKKTKRKSVIDPDEPIFGSVATTAAAAVLAAAAADHTQEDTEQSQAEIPAPRELREVDKAPIPSLEPSGPPASVQDVEPVAEPEEDIWGFSTKKTKREKKKKQRQSTFDDYSSTPSAPVTPAEPSQVDRDLINPLNEPARSLASEKQEGPEAEEPTLAAATVPTAQVMEDEFPIIGKKKSKKEKKKKTLLSLDEENDASTDHLRAVNEPQLSISGEQVTVMDMTAEPATMRDVGFVDFGSSQILDSEVVPESGLPTVQQHFNATETPIVDQAYSKGPDLASGGNPVEVEREGQWGFPTTKKGKKGKKTKKGKNGEVESTFTADDDERQNFDSQKEAQSRSFAFPGTFENVTESGLQSLEVSEAADVKEEQSVPQVTEEPEMNSEDISEHAVPEGDPRDPGQPQNIGLGIATVAPQVAASQATGGQAVPNDDEPLSQHEALRYAVHHRPIHDQEEQRERALLHPDQSPDMPPALEAPETRQLQSTWSFANLKQDTTHEHSNRDSGIQVSDSPLVQAGHLQPTLRDSGYAPSPIAAASREISAEEEEPHNALARPPRPTSPTSSSEDLRQTSHDHSMEPYQPEAAREMDDPALLPSEPYALHHDQTEMLARRHPSPVDSTTKDRSSALFNSSPSNRTDAYGSTPRLDTQHMQAPITELHRSPSVHGHRSREDLRSLTPSRSPNRYFRQNSNAPIAESMQEDSQQLHHSIFGPFPTADEHDRGLSPPRTPLQTIHEHVPDTSPSNRRRRPRSDVGSPDRGHKSVQRSSVGDLDYRPEAEHPSDVSRTQIHHGQPSAAESERESESAAAGNHGRALAEVGGLAAVAGAAAAATQELRPTSRDDKPGDTKSLGKSKSRSTSSKQLRQSQTSLDNIASSSTHDPVREKGKAAARDMADVYNGYGEFPGAPMSPTRPPSVRSRRSMQQLKDLEARLDQLASENRLLATAKINAEQQLQDLHFAQSRTEHASQEALELRDAELREKDEAIAKMRDALNMMQKEVARLTEVNEGLMTTHEEMRSTHEQRYSQLEEQHTETHEQWQESSRELEDLKSKHAELSTGMEEIVRHELDNRLADKDAEIQRLHDELEDAKAKIRELQQQILAGQSDEIIVARDEDYFDSACQQLCQHVQQWVLRFSKFSDTRVCRLTNEVRDEKVVDRFDNAILDGSDVDLYLRDRVKRRDVFMSVVMTMIWEYIFTRYLFGMDREQRQKLKLLEKNLSEVGPQSAVHRWRAMTLTILSKRESFQGQRASDTEAVVQQIYSTLARFLPPPQQLQGQIQESLRKVMKAAVDLSIEMRTQRAEYIMLPPLQPEYDTNGDLARKVYFNAALMNERSGETTSNDELEVQQAVVRMVLFPLVVKKGSDTGEGDEEIVVCPAQVLVARSGKDEKVVKAVSGDRMSIDQANRSVQSFAPSVLDPTNVI